MSQNEKILADQVSALLAEAEQTDKAEDTQFDKDRRGDELPGQLRHRETRLAKLRDAKQVLEAQTARRGVPKPSSTPSTR